MAATEPIRDKKRLKSLANYFLTRINRNQKFLSERLHPHPYFIPWLFHIFTNHSIQAATTARQQKVKQQQRKKLLFPAPYGHTQTFLAPLLQVIPVQNDRIRMKTERFCNIAANIVRPVGKKDQIFMAQKSMGKQIGQGAAEYLGHTDTSQCIQILLRSNNRNRIPHIYPLLFR